MTDHPSPATLTVDDRQTTLPVASATVGESGLGIGSLLKDTGHVTYDVRDSSTRPRARARSPLSTATRGSCVTAVTPSSSWRRTRSFVETCYLLDLRRTAHRSGPACLRRPASPPHLAARGPAGVLLGIPPRRPPDARALLGGERPLDLLPGLARPVRPDAGRDLDHPAVGQAAHDRGLRLQEEHRSALPLPRQLTLAHLQLPADDLRHPGRGVCR
jgi:hypothetical protein